MGSRNVCIWPATKTVAFLQILCTLALFLLPFLSDAKTFVFAPTKQPAYYSDTANWVNRDYPGTTLAIEDSILFELSAGMNEATIDSNCYFLGTCIIGKGLKWYVPLGVNVTVGSESYTQSNYQYFSTGIIAEDSSLIQIGGQLVLRKHGVFKGVVAVSGSIFTRSPSHCGFYYCEPVINLSYNELEVSGIFNGSVTQLHGRKLTVNNNGYLKLYPGWEPITSKLSGIYIMNSGKIELTSGVEISADTILNIIGGDIKAGAISGVLKNAGTVYIWGVDRMNSKTADLRSLENSGSLFIRGWSNYPVYINGAINHGVLQLSSVASIAGSVHNYGSFFVDQNEACDVVVNMSGPFYNYSSGRFSFLGQLLMNSTYFSNSGSCFFSTWTSGCYLKTKTEFRTPILNWGTCTFQGQHNIYEAFTNFGTCNMEGGQYGTSSLYSIFDNRGICNVTGKINIFGDFINGSGSSFNFKK